MTDSEFLLHMVALLNKEKKLTLENSDFDEVLPRVEFILQLAKFITALDSNGTDGVGLDRGTHLAIRRAMEKYGQELDPDDDSELENDYERITTLNPCSKKHLPYLQQLLEDKEKGEDLKILAYLFMRKCYIPEWRSLVNKYVYDKEANKDVFNFILRHITNINRLDSQNDRILPEDAAIMSNITGWEDTKFGGTIFFRKSTDLGQYGQAVGRLSGMEFQLNFIKGMGILPRYLSMQMDSLGNDGERESLELDILRLESEKDKTPEIIVTFSQSKVTLWTTTLEFDQHKLLELLQNGGQDSNGVFEMFKDFFTFNKASLAKLFQNRKFEGFRWLLLDENRRSFPSISGLPIIARTNWNRFLTYNFTQHHTKDSHTFRFHPTLVIRDMESISVGMGRVEILGYQVASSITLDLNLEFSLSRNPEGVYKIRIGLGRDNSDAHTFQWMNLDLFKLQRFQVGKQFEREESGAIFQPGGQMIRRWGPGGECGFANPFDGFHKQGAMYFWGSLFCDIPSAIVVEGKISGPPWRSSYVKIYPEGGVTSAVPQDRKETVFIVRSDQDAETSEVKNVQIHIRVPFTYPRQELNVTLILKSDKPIDTSLLVNYNGFGGKFGFVLFNRGSVKPETWRFKYSNTTGQIKDELKTGLHVWTPFNYPVITMTLLSEDTGHKSSRTFNLWMAGIHPLIDFNVTLFGSSDLVQDDDPTVPQILQREHKIGWITSTASAFVFENQFLGRVTATFYGSNYTSPLPLEGKRNLGSLLIKYGQEEGQHSILSGQNISWNFMSKETLLPDVNGTRNLKKKIYESNITSSQYPDLDIISTFHVLSGSNEDGSCPNRVISVHGKIDRLAEPDEKSTVILEYDQNLVDSDLTGCEGQEECGCKTALRKVDVHLPLFGRYQKIDSKGGTNLIEIGIDLRTLLSSTTETIYLKFMYKSDPVDNEDLAEPLTLLLDASRIHRNGTTTTILFRTEHNLVQISKALVKYKGFVSKFQSLGSHQNTVSGLPRLEWDGVVVIQPSDQFPYKGMQFNLTEVVNENYNNSRHELSLTKIPEDTSTSYNLLLVDSNSTENRNLLDWSVKKSEGLISVKFLVAGYIDASLDLGNRNAHSVISLTPANLKVVGNLSAMPGDDGVAFLGFVNVSRLNSGVDLFAIKSVSKLGFPNVTESIVAIFGQDNTYVGNEGWNFGFTSRSTLTTNLRNTNVNLPGNISLDITYQLLPHEDADQPIFAISLRGEEEFGIFGIRLSSQINQRTDSAENVSITFGNWLRLEHFSSASPFTLSSVWTFDRQDSVTRSEEKTGMYVWGNSWRNELKMVHRRFFTSKLDTELFSTVGYNNHWLGMYDEVPETSMAWDHLRNSTTNAGMNLVLKAEGDQSWPETKLEGNAVVTDDLPGKKRKMDASAHYGVVGKRHHNLKFGINICKHDVPGSQNSGAVNKTTDLEWSWRERVENVTNGNGETQEFVSQGNHSINAFCENLRNFEIRVNHTVDTFLGKYIWEDKLFREYTHPDQGHCGISSSHLFSALTTTTPLKIETEIEIFPPTIYSKFLANYEEFPFNTSLSTDDDSYSFNRTKYGLSISSNIFHKINGTFVEYESGSLISPIKNEAAYMTNFNVDLSSVFQPLGRRNISRLLKQRKDSSSTQSVELITHQLSQIHDMKGDHSHHQERWEWQSALALVQDENHSPEFIHYDYNVDNILQDMKTKEERSQYFVSGAVSSSARPGQMFFQFRKDSKKSRGLKYRNKEILLRLGGPSKELAEMMDGIVCEKSDFHLSSMIDRFVSDWMDDVVGFYLIKQGCDGLGVRKPADWGQTGVGTLVWHEFISKDVVDALSVNPNNLTEPILWNDMTLATWSKEGTCSAKGFMGSPTELDDTRDFDKTCTTTLQELGGSGCWVGIDGVGGKCNNSTPVQLWSSGVKKLNPMTVLRTADSVMFPYIFGTFIFF